jgi:MinD-like ATPase involved in chromosome partitioning or flagellar assembly
MRIYLAIGDSIPGGDTHILSLETRGSLRVVGSAHTNENLLDKLSNAQPDVAIISNACAGSDPIRFLADVRTTLPELRVVFIGGNEDIFQSLIGMGIYDLLVANRLKLADIDERIFHPAVYADVAHFLKVKPNQVATDRLRRNELVAFWSPTGGTGKSTMALNYALMRAGNVLLVDLDIQTPVLDLYSGFSGQRKDLYDLLVQEPLTPDGLRRFLYPLSSEIASHQLLPGLIDLNRFDAINIDHFKRLFGFITSRFDCVVVDINSCPFIDATYAALNAADTIYIVAINDYASLREAVRYHKYFTDNLMMPSEKFQLIINKYTEQGTDVTNITSGLPWPVTTVIPYSPLITASTCAGKPFVLSRDRSLRKTIDTIAQIAGQHTVRRKLFGYR